ncbi:hypothetical protein FKW77_001396 [Venturia effusa]|uniref:Carbamoyl phosphate synthase arginine-specific small chain n=1 Tax=Venturia effusa TaxID=50376 RepID=A0A517LGJ4_9PEZI|nr:hypothetical protein FKW77_001396 [Venturia effusa]
MFKTLFNKTQGLGLTGRIAAQRRFLATVQTNAPRRTPENRPRATPVTYDRATFTIKDGKTYTGKSFGANRNISGEAVFTTSLVGYPESMTDPSYRGQILVFTQPLIGNYGVPSAARDEHGLLRYFESANIQAAGIVVADYAAKHSHWTAVESLSEWCAREGVPAISGVDTRDIVTFLREQGSSLGRITIGEEYDADEDEAYVDPEAINLVKRVSTKAPFHVSSNVGDLHVALIDCGVKENILRSLVSRGASVTCFPYNYPIHKVAHHFDGVFLSNGPGDPTHCQETVYNLRKLMESSQIPIMGICMGHQLLALAAGARTIKLKYGNRAHNIPALDLTTGKCHITSQNHGYAVDATTLPSDWKEYFVNLNDSSNEGMIHKSRPIFSAQFHPEAKGGPLDSAFLFDSYIDNVAKYKQTQAIFSQQDNKPSPLLVDLLAKDRVGVHPGLPDFQGYVKTETPIWEAFGRGWTFHHFGLAITAVFSAIATLIAGILMLQHARHYSRPWEQKHIIRILFMIPVYAIVSLVSYVFYKHAIYWEVLRDCYEAFAIASFFTLLCHYLEPTLTEQKNHFRKVTPRNWVWPIPWFQKCSGGPEKGIFRIPRSGLTWFNIIYVGVYQYCFIRVVFTFVAMFTQLFGRYCQSSLNPAFAHVWVMCFEALSVTVAMYCLIQFYLQLKVDLAEHRPFLKVLCIKLVIFFSFWQSILISFLSSSSAPGGAVLKPSDKIAEPDIQVGIPSALLAIEMSIFAVVHIFAFSYKPYDIRKSPDPQARYRGGIMGWKAILEAFNLWDIVKASARGFRWLFVGARKREQDISYAHHRAGSEPPLKLEQIQTGYQETGLEGAGSAGHFAKETYRPSLPPRRETNDSDDRAALLSNPQNVPKINLQQPSPYGDDLGSGPYRTEPGQYQDARGDWPSGYDENHQPWSRPYNSRR